MVSNDSIESFAQELARRPFWPHEMPENKRQKTRELIGKWIRSNSVAGKRIGIQVSDHNNGYTVIINAPAHDGNGIFGETININ